jgi:hypothetical protein
VHLIFLLILCFNICCVKCSMTVSWLFLGTLVSSPWIFLYSPLRFMKTLSSIGDMYIMQNNDGIKDEYKIWNPLRSKLASSKICCKWLPWDQVSALLLFVWSLVTISCWSLYSTWNTYQENKFVRKVLHSLVNGSIGFQCVFLMAFTKFESGFLHSYIFCI